MAAICFALALWINPHQVPARIHRPESRRLRAKPLLIGVAVTLGVLALVRLSVLLSAGMLLGVLVRIIKKWQQSRRHNNLSQHMSQVLGIVVAELSSGASIQAAITHAGQECNNEELARVLHQAARRVTTGGSGAAVLREYVEAIPPLEILASAWQLAERYGCSQVLVLEQAQRTLDQQLTHDQRLRANLQGATMTAGILSLLPLIGMALGFALGVNTVAFLFSGGIGGLLLVAGTGCSCAGILLSQHILQGARSIQ